MKGILYTFGEKEINQILIGKDRYKVYICKILKFNNKNYVGFVDYKERSIFLKKEDKCIRETLIHEILHTFLHEIYKKQKKKYYKKLRSNESFVERLGYLISQNFKLKDFKNL